MGFYEDMERSLLETIEMERDNIPLVQKENMPAPTFVAADEEKKQATDKMAAVIRPPPHKMFKPHMQQSPQ